MAAAKRLIVNADDLGLSAAINAGIIQAHRNGIVTSTSIVASGECFEQGVEMARSHPNLGVGVHLTLVEENVVALPASVPTLAPNGVLPRLYGELVKSLMLGRTSLKDVERELRAQIEKCLLAGIKPTHLDSHQHTHALPLIFPIAVRLANDYKIPGIRVPRGFPALRDISVERFAGKCVLCALAHADAILFSLGSAKTTDRFAGLFESGILNQSRLSAILNGLKPDTTELVAHPGTDDPSPRYARWNKRRQMELASLSSDTTRELIDRNQITLINYGQIG